MENMAETGLVKVISAAVVHAHILTKDSFSSANSSSSRSSSSDFRSSSSSSSSSLIVGGSSSTILDFFRDTPFVLPLDCLLVDMTMSKRARLLLLGLGDQAAADRSRASLLSAVGRLLRVPGWTMVFNVCGCEKTRGNK